jgi:hypothetical protein
LKKQVPTLNLNCDELAEEAHQAPKVTSFIQLEQNEDDYVPERSNDMVMDKINKIEKMIDKIDQSVKHVNNELNELKINFLGGAFRKDEDGQQQSPLKIKTSNDLEINLEDLKNNKNHNEQKNDLNAFGNLFNGNKPVTIEQLKGIPIVDNNKVNHLLTV